MKRKIFHSKLIRIFFRMIRFIMSHWDKRFTFPIYIVFDISLSIQNMQVQCSTIESISLPSNFMIFIQSNSFTIIMKS